MTNHNALTKVDAADLAYFTVASLIALLALSYLLSKLWTLWANSRRCSSVILVHGYHSRCIKPKGHERSNWPVLIEDPHTDGDWSWYGNMATSLEADLDADLHYLEKTRRHNPPGSRDRSKRGKERKRNRRAPMT